MGTHNFSELDNKDLAHLLSEWMGDAANSWQRFTKEEKLYFRSLQDVACRRFIAEHDSE